MLLYEKDDRLGGQLNLASMPPYKLEIRGLTEFLISEVQRLGIEIHCGVEVTGDLIETERPDELILATGATPRILEIPGIDSDMVCTAWDVLNGSVEVRNKVIVAGGGTVGCEVAEHLAEKGHVVTIASQSAAIGKDIEQNTRRYLLKRLGDLGVTVLTNTKTMKIENGNVILGTYGSQWSAQCDQLVMAKGALPDRKLVGSLKRSFPGFFIIGDALEPRSAHEAIYEGARIGRVI
ncbi:hypothetical protein DSCW_00540 [Desulfosarcina widdelii]|uniref:FAD/NAD(P)-binding domain-containing protein n=1 Tax=Desulfosarcina widdelii TaxID=947919 RepID=A0A5K7Z816_9BACT|nr:hypothetical protein DSCW_00540 [Desulfosarcina widdelii]